MNFDKIIKLDQTTLKSKVVRQLKFNGYADIVSADGFVYAPGELPVMLIAHMDTVHANQVTDLCKSATNVWMSPQGIGGDDRCGIYSILQIIKHYKCHVLFTEDEERGCIGATKFVATDIRPDVNFLIELDRKGSNDCVFYQCDNPKFTEFIESFGFKTAYGSCSDISKIAPHLGVAAVNLSCGYYNPHSQSEYIVLDDMWNTIRRVEQILDGEMPKFEYIKKEYKTTSVNSWWTDSSKISWWTDTSKTVNLSTTDSKAKDIIKMPLSETKPIIDIAPADDKKIKKLDSESKEAEYIIWLYTRADDFYIRTKDGSFTNCCDYGIDPMGNLWFWDPCANEIWIVDSAEYSLCTYDQRELDIMTTYEKLEAELRVQADFDAWNACY